MVRGITRRRLMQGASAALCVSLAPAAWPSQKARASQEDPLFRISLAEWSLHKTLFDNKLDHRKFAETARNEFGIEAVEFVNQFFKDRARDRAYIDDLKKRADDAGVKVLLIMIDGEGALGDPQADRRTQAVANHQPWVEAAARLGCHSIRVNAHSDGSFAETQKLAADGLHRLSEFAAGSGLNVIVENHGGLSSNGEWLSGVMRAVDMKNCGTLPDFGNFQVSETEEYDRYKGVQELMPFAKGVSAKSHDFDADGNETHTDYRRMLKIVLDAGYRGYIGIEYEGPRLSEPEGIRATKSLLERVRQEMS